MSKKKRPIGSHPQESYRKWTGSHNTYTKNPVQVLCTSLMEVSLMRDKQSTDLWVQQKVIRSHFITTFFFLQQYLVLLKILGLYSLKIFDTQAVSSMGFISWGGPSVKSSTVWLLPQILLNLCTDLSWRQEQYCRSKDWWAHLVFTFLLW